MSMGSFGEELRMERLNRGIALEKITEVTKISQRHLVALEENQFRVLPGGILNKGIVRGYVNVLGLDEMDWVTRFQRAYAASGELLEDDRNWIEFAANVGRARVRPRDAATERLKWAGAMLLLLIGGLCRLFAVRYYGYRSGWWPTVIPGREPALADALGAQVGHKLIAPFEDQTAGFVDLEHAACVADAAIGNHQAPGRSGLPCGFLRASAPVEARELGFCKGLPQLVGRGADIGDVDKGLVRH
jgi:cytoskeleton protein RodZ